jgi:hypothetical protein
MKRLCFLVSLILIVGCSPANTGGKTLEEYRMSTDIPSAAELAATAQAEVVSSTPPKDCPVTLPQEPAFTPPAPYSDLGWDGYFWYGSNSLWASIPVNGVWLGLPHNPNGYTQKIPWWREGYSWDKEPEPDLIVTGERLDGKAPPLDASSANGSYAKDMGSAMMMGVDFPTLGCWKITGKYQDAELSFVVWVAP